MTGDLHVRLSYLSIYVRDTDCFRSEKITLSLRFPIYLSLRFPVSLSICLPICLLVCLSACLLVFSKAVFIHKSKEVYTFTTSSPRQLMSCSVSSSPAVLNIIESQASRDTGAKFAVVILLKVSHLCKQWWTDAW